MHNPFTLLLAYDILTRPNERRIFNGTILDGLDAPDLVATATADINSGKIQIRYLAPFGDPDTYVIPQQKGDNAAYLTSPFVFSTELRDAMAGAEHIYLYAEHDDEMVERNYHRIFSSNIPLKNVYLEGWSDGLKIEKVDSFTDFVTETFVEMYLSKAGYNPKSRRRNNPLKELTNTIFHGKCEGRTAEEFEKLFPAPECKVLIIDVIKRWYES